MAGHGTEAWEIRASDFPADGSTADKFRFLLGYAILAPSGHNTQPWLFRLKKDAVELYADRTRALAVSDPDDRELLIACGAALLQLRVAMRRFGWRGDVVLHPEPDDPDLIARVRPGTSAAPSADETALFDAITRRRTNRRRFEMRDVPQSLLAQLASAASSESAWLSFVQDPHQKHAVAELIAAGDREQGGDRAFRREMAAWAHPGRARSRDGLPGFTYGVGDVPHFVGPTVLRTFEAGAAGEPATGEALAEGSPALAVLGTGSDAPQNWVVAGQALGRVLLRARVDDVHASYLNQPVEVADLRVKLRTLLGLSGFPQLVLRFGYGPEVAPTPRRALEDVILP